MLGSRPQGEKDNPQQTKNGNVQLKYNGDLSILNDVQKVDGTNGAPTHLLNQRIVTQNNDGEELLKIAQSKVDGDG
ncbi:MAG: hypothetical protein GF331_02665, partial [Chitinivibrionales bacterium]|nr:hypothetical protein [Chitinivibrionales bacterium]